tara:strand:+ start:766 stop:903 length:138 start_codon:yes stop_codon:yes gene_type:complete
MNNEHPSFVDRLSTSKSILTYSPLTFKLKQAIKINTTSKTSSVKN